jgi:hypothetical protein
MEEQPERLKLPIVEVETSPSNDPWYSVISILLIVAALVFAGVGWLRSTTTPTMLVLLAVTPIISLSTPHGEQL